jgi:cbb3-type cytochrome oxidase maturation protein
MGATLLLIIASLALGLGAWLLFLWAVKSDQYDDVEEPKHRMLEDEPAKPQREETLGGEKDTKQEHAPRGGRGEEP